MQNNKEKSNSILDTGIKLRVIYKNDLDFIKQIIVHKSFIDSVSLYPNPKKIFHRNYNKKPVIEWDRYDEDTQFIIRFLNQYNIKIYLLLDFTDLDPNTVENYNDSGLRFYLKRLINESGLKKITVFNLPLAAKIKNDFPEISLEISGNAVVDNVEKARGWLEAVEVDSLCVPCRLNKKLKTLNQLKKKTNLKLSIIVNNCCLTNCPAEISCKNLGPYLKEYFSFFDCRVAMAEKPWQAYRQGYIVPANLKQYQGIIDTAVIDGEGMSVKEVMAQVVHYSQHMDSYEYCNASLKGTLPFYHPYAIGEEPPEVFGRVSDCDSDCESCHYCCNVWEQYSNAPDGIEHCLRGYSYLKRHDYKSAVLSFNEYMNISGCRIDANLCYNIGVCYKNLNEYDKAVQYFTKAVKLNPEYDRSRTELEEVQKASEQEKEQGTKNNKD